MENKAGADFGHFVTAGSRPVVLQVLPALHSGGVEQGVVDMNAALVKAGARSIVVSSGGPRVHDITRAGGEHILLPVDSKNPLTMALNARRLRAIIRKEKVDIVHAASRAPAWSAARAVKGTQARYVTSCHSAHKISGSLKRYYNSSIAGGERVIAVSAFLADYLEKNYGLPRDIIRVVHRGVALERFHPTCVSAQRMVAVAQQMRIPEGASVIMLPGRLSRIKGHAVLLEALSRLQRKDFFCLFVGSVRGNEDYGRELEKLTVSLGLEGRCRIVGDCSDLPAAYMLATVVACPSLVPEGFGRIAIEAQAMGRPVVSTNHGGARETIIDGETGWLVTPNDAGDLARAIEQAMALDAEGRAHMATRAMAHVAAHFTNERMCRATMDVYAELLRLREEEEAARQQAQAARAA